MRWRRYPEYKESGVEWLGEIPGHWESRRLKYCANLVNEKVNGRESHLPYIGLEHIESWTGRLLSNEETPTSDGQSNLFQPGDVLFGKLRPYLAKALRATAGGICTGELLVLRPGSVTQDYLFNYLLTRDFIATVDSSTYGAKMPRANWEFIGNLPMLIPPEHEQRVIATFLDRETEHIDALIAKKERQIELLQEKRAALISHAVTKGLDPNVPMKDSGVEWLGEIPGHWRLVPLKFAVVPQRDAVKTGPFGSQLLSSEMLSGTVKVYNQRSVLDRDFQQGENYITNEKYAQLEAFTIYPGDLLITTRGTIGRCALFPSDAELGILHPCLMRVQPDSCKVIPEYLTLLIQDSILVHAQLALMSNATTIEVIYSDSLKRVQLPLPPITEQVDLLSQVEYKTGKLDRLLEMVEESITRLHEYRTALISAAVTGKIDVREKAGGVA